LELSWDKAQSIQKVLLFLDVDYDHAMETVQWHHPEDAMPFCVKHYRLSDADGNVLAEDLENYKGRVEINFNASVVTDALTLELLDTHGCTCSTLFDSGNGIIYNIHSRLLYYTLVTLGLFHVHNSGFSFEYTIAVDHDSTG
jgi:hypothetical protein